MGIQSSVWLCYSMLSSTTLWVFRLTMMVCSTHVHTCVCTYKKYGNYHTEAFLGDSHVLRTVCVEWPCGIMEKRFWPVSREIPSSNVTSAVNQMTLGKLFCQLQFFICDMEGIKLAAWLQAAWLLRLCRWIDLNSLNAFYSHKSQQV